MEKVLFIVDIIAAVSALFGGWYMKYRSPLDDTMQYGFRTRHSTLSELTWSFANKTCGGYWLITGIAGLAASIAALMLTDGKAAKTAAIVLMFVIIGAMSISCTTVLMKLMQRFDERGNERE